MPALPRDTLGRTTMVTDYDRGHPVVTCYRHGAHLVFWCDRCDRLHRHGVCCDGTCDGARSRGLSCTHPLGHGDGHRAAHCHPAASAGYRLREVPITRDVLDALPPEATSRMAADLLGTDLPEARTELRRAGFRPVRRGVYRREAERMLSTHSS